MKCIDCNSMPLTIIVTMKATFYLLCLSHSRSILEILLIWISVVLVMN